MKSTKVLFLSGVFVALCVVPSFAASVASVSAFPARTVPGATLMLNTSVVSSTTQPITVTVTTTNPGTCVSAYAKTLVGKVGMNLRANVLRAADLSFTLPMNVCAGTYGVQVVVKNSSTGATLVTRSTSFTVQSAP